MKILTLDNQAYDLETLPDEVDDLRFAILDNSNPLNVDYHYIPLIFLESFNAPAVVLEIGNKTIKMPVDWQVLIGHEEHGDLETIPLSSLNDRGFTVFAFNPLTSFSPSFLDIEIPTNNILGLSIIKLMLSKYSFVFSSKKEMKPKMLI